MLQDSVKSCSTVYRTTKNVLENKEKLLNLLKDKIQLMQEIKQLSFFDIDLNRKLNLLNHKIEVTKNRCESHISNYHKRGRFEYSERPVQFLE